MSRSNPRPGRSAQATKLARERIRRGVTQQELADAIGLAIASYQRLERGNNANPGIRTLQNCALALGVPLDDLIEDEWREWLVMDQSRAAQAPNPAGFWRRLD